LAAIFAASIFAAVLMLTFVLWRRYIQAGERAPQADTCRYCLTDVFGDHHLVNVPHQQGVRWLGEVFSRSAEKFPDLTALQIPSTGQSLTFADRAADRGQSGICDRPRRACRRTSSDRNGQGRSLRDRNGERHLPGRYLITTSKVAVNFMVVSGQQNDVVSPHERPFRLLLRIS
jgi:hypothetical protein